ncbi:hypothetical protein MTO96_039412 [Rhipicephalus appendiculatus]
MADMSTYGLKTSRRDRLFQVRQLCRGFDYILTCNLPTAVFCFGSLWWEGLQASRVFEGDSERFRTSCKTLSDSDTMKKTKNTLSDDDRVCLYECASLFGAMCPPVTGWDPTKETEELASDGQRAQGLVLDSDLDSEGILDRIHNLIRYKPGRVCANRPFEEWLMSYEWERSGSSSIVMVTSKRGRTWRWMCFYSQTW